MDINPPALTRNQPSGGVVFNVFRLGVIEQHIVAIWCESGRPKDNGKRELHHDPFAALAGQRLHPHGIMADDEEPMRPLRDLVDRLRVEVTELQGRLEALNEELEDKRRRLRHAEATLELQERPGGSSGALTEGGDKSDDSEVMAQDDPQVQASDALLM
jgi:hypothetical protein